MLPDYAILSRKKEDYFLFRKKESNQRKTDLKNNIPDDTK